MTPEPTPRPPSAALSVDRVRMRHGLATVVMALISVGTFAVIGLLLAGIGHDAGVVNTAGRQRMLSQAIALQVMRLESGGERASEARQALRGLVDRMAGDHAALSAGATEPLLQAAYHEGPDALDRRVGAFLDHARALAEAPDDAAAVGRGHEALVDEAAALLPRLDAAVALHEQGARARLSWVGEVTVLLAVTTALALAALWMFVFGPVTRLLHREQRRARAAEARHEVEHARQVFARRLDAALEMVDDEPPLIDTVGRAFDHLGPPLPLELLLADSSRAHLRLGAEHPTAGRRPCAVETPWQCIAIRRGRTSHFPDARALDACPKLRGGDACGALCVPVTFLGETLGVIHATLDVDETPDPEWVARLEHLAGSAAARLSAIRSFRQVQLQATTDPLTGLLNRRSLEEAIRRMVQDGAPFAVAMADLDHFKRLNDTHGHDAGDRALATFAKACGEVIREGDLVARFGGEEFVLVFRGADAVQGARVLERLREHLARVVAGGDTPTFTASYGISDTRVGHDLAMLLQVADAALLRAKETGRDRVIVADMGEPQAVPEPLHAVDDEAA